ncbi:MAG: DUF4139 domain-containing protein, partial [Candidatus Altiarchaeota archaeon]|nr:DUF4139 domain-containing protein [Candidatus Altiarchaeota archaeon]
MVKRSIILAAILLLVVSAVLSVELFMTPVVINEEPVDTEITVYNQNFGVVKEYRSKFLNKGLNRVLYEGVASAIDPTSVKLKALTGTINVLEQNFQYDLVSKSKILEKYVGKNITAYLIYGDKKELVEGELLSQNGYELIIRGNDGSIQTLNSGNLVLPGLPEGLILKPTLEWLVESSESKNQTLELSYITSGMGWKADYVAVVDKDDKNLDLNGWVTVTNNAGTTFKDASLKLVAGDVRRVTGSQPSGYAYEDVMYAKAAGYQPQFSEESLFEYHLYDLQRKTTIKDNEQKQVSLLESSGVGAEKEFVYENNYWITSNSKVQVKMNFNNSQANNLGIPLPKGVVRVFKKDSEGKLQFIGEDQIDHTPKDETVRLYLGDAFDVVGERKQMDYEDLGSYYEYQWEVTLRNHKSEDIVVTVLENTGGDWEIKSENYPHIKESNHKIKWRIPVKANGE